MKLETRYELVEKVASGSFATVYRAKDLELGREVAVKQIHEHFLDDPKQLDRYWQEAQLLASLHHPNIVTIFDLVRERGWLIMELMQGNLGARQGGRPMDLNALRTVLAHCLRALKFLHEHGIIHGDIKPSNIMIDRRKRVKLGDFGLARRVSDDEGSLLKGTTKYMAPEVVSDEFGEVGPASDLYSLGFVAYELMCGSNFETLFPGLSAFGRDKQVAWMMWHAAPDRRLPEVNRVLEGVPDDIARVIQKLTTKKRSERYASADQALADLHIDLKSAKSGDDSDPNLTTEANPDKRRRMLAIGAFSVSALMCLLMLVWPSGPRGSQTQQAGAMGVIRSVDADAHKIIIVDDRDGAAQELDLGERPRIMLLNTRQNILPRELQPGDRIRVERLSGKSDAVRFVASRPAATEGHIKRIDRDTHNVIVAPDTGALRDDLILRVQDTTKITLNGKDASLAELEADDRVSVHHLADVQDETRQTAESIDALRMVSLSGFIGTVDLSNHALTVEVPQGSKVQSVRLALKSDCTITLPDGSTRTPETLKQDELKKGDRVSLRYDTTIAEVRASRNLRLSGTIDQIDEDGKLLQILTADRSSRSLLVGPETQIEINGTAGPASELRRYDEVHASYSETAAGELEGVTIDAHRAPRNDRWAILICVQNYQDKSLPRVPYAIESAKLLADTLKARYAFAPERLKMMIDPDKAALEQGLRPILENALGQTQVVVYVMALGYADDQGRAYLAPKNFDPQAPDLTGVSLQWLADELQRCPSLDKLLLLDSSQVAEGRDFARYPSSAEMLKSLRAPEGGSPFRVTAAIANCSPEQRSLLGADRRHGLFAACTAAGFRGAADADRDLHITAQELFDYLKTAVPDAAKEQSKPQTPVLFYEP